MAFPINELPVDLSSAWVGEGQPISIPSPIPTPAQPQPRMWSSTCLPRVYNSPERIQSRSAPLSRRGGVLTIPADMLAGVLSGELRLEIADTRHGPFEWLWSLHRVDKEPPQNPLTLQPAALYVRPGL